LRLTGLFASSFVFVSQPFHIQRISTTDPAATLRWTGWILGITSLVCLAAFATANSVWLYGGLRFLQVLSIAPVFPLVVARLAEHAGGAAIGIINSARIGAGFIGPVVATTLLTWTSPGALYVLLAAIGLACVPLVTTRQAGARA
jgi:MFS family permease